MPGKLNDCETRLDVAFDERDFLTVSRGRVWLEGSMPALCEADDLPAIFPHKNFTSSLLLIAFPPRRFFTPRMHSELLSFLYPLVARALHSPAA